MIYSDKVGNLIMWQDGKKNVSPKVSIIVPCYNQEKYLDKCLSSLVNQSLLSIEIICINDGSLDKTLDILKNYAKNDSRIKIIDKNNSGYGDSINKGMDISNGDYIAIVEPDDYVNPDMFQILYHIASTKNVDVVKADFCRFVGNEFNEIHKIEKIAPHDYCNRIICPQKCQEVFDIVKMNTWAGIYRAKMINEHNIRHNTSPGASYQDNGFWFKTTVCASSMYLYDAMPLYMNRRDNPNSSVYAKDKLYAIFEEYHYIEEWLKDTNNFDKYRDIFYYKKFTTYYWHYLRIGRLTPDKVQEFRIIFSKEFNKLYNSNHLNKEIFDQFNKTNWKRLMNIINNPIKQPLKPYYSNNNISICYSSDEYYVPILAVSIASLIKNSSSSYNYDIIILEKELSYETIISIETMSLHKDNISIRFYDVDELVNINNYNELTNVNHISPSDYKLFIASIFSNYSRVLYLDCDSVVISDISELYNMDLKNNMCAATVDLGATYFDRGLKKYHEIEQNTDSTISIENLPNYFNSGVVVFDIDKIKNANREKQILGDIKRINGRINSQNILNSVFENSYSQLSFKWNYQWNVTHRYPEYKKLMKNDLEDFEKAIKEPNIIHYNGPIKPWNNNTWQYSDLFWKYAENTPFENILAKYKKESDVPSLEQNSMEATTNPKQTIVKLINENEKLKREPSSTHPSFLYKLGRLIAYLPRKISRSKTKSVKKSHRS